MDYRVDSFHINIGAGDAAIHILSSGPNTGSSITKRKVQRAVFIDGGTSHGGKPRWSISQAIFTIEFTFECQGQLKPGDSGNRYLIFDAFIITHWDEDHFAGILEFLKDDIQQLVDRQKGGSVTQPLGLSRAWYDKDTVTGKTVPSSWFYAPYWIDKHAIKEKLGGKLKDVFTRDTDDNMTITVTQAGTGMSISAPGMLKIRTDTERLLGRDFFNDSWDGSWQTQWGAMSSVQGLLNANPPSDPVPDLKIQNRAGMYCIAVNEQALKNDAAVMTTDTNKSSICIMIIWTSGFCSHYFAGDAHSKLEERLVHWAGRNEMINGGVPSIKLSHHGARTSNPESIFKGFVPRNIIVSAGSSNGHPREYPCDRSPF